MMRQNISLNEVLVVMIKTITLSIILASCVPKIKITAEDTNKVAAAAQDLSVPTNSSLPITLSATSAANLTLTYTIVGSPSHGVLTGTAPSLTYTPTASFVGSDSFTFKVNNSGVATILITVTAPSNSAPVATAQSMNVSYNTATAVTLAGTDPESDSLTYTIVSGPSHGSLTGTAPALTYTPTSGYYGADSFTFKINDGTVDSNMAIVSLTVLQLTIYLRSAADTPAGNDSTGIANNPTLPFLTAQAAVNAAIAQTPAVNKPVVIDVGSLYAGNFGNVILTQNFGQYVSWKGVNSTHSVIGNLSANGLDGQNPFDDPNGNGGNGTNAYHITLTADGNVKFNSLSATGGDCTGQVYGGTSGTTPGIAGSFTLSKIVTNSVTANGGSVNTFLYEGDDCGVRAGGTVTSNESSLGIVRAEGGNSYNWFTGLAGGNVTLNTNSTAISVSVLGSLSLYGGPGGSVTLSSGSTVGNIIARGSDGSQNDISGSGGTVTVNATATVTGNVNASSGGNGGSGNGGHVTVAGTVNGNVLADVAGNGNNNSGSAGSITVSSTGQVGGTISASGNGGSGASGGSIIISGIVRDVYANGDTYSNVSGYVGSGGTIRVNSGASTLSLYANGQSAPNGSWINGGTGGQIIYSLTSSINGNMPPVVAGHIFANFGSGDTANGFVDGNPGTITTIP